MKILKIVFWHTHACCFFFCVLFSAARLSVIHNKDLLATIHLLVAMARCFQPELDLPPNVKVEVAVVEVSFSFFFFFFCSESGLKRTPWNRSSIMVHFNPHPGQQEWNQITRTDRSPNGGTVSGFLFCVIL